MPTPEGVTKPVWRGIPRQEIEWHPTVDLELCTGCGICVLGCGKGVYQFDYKKNIAIVAHPLNCLVGCTTCENICPQRAASFPPMSYLHRTIRKRGVIQLSRKGLASNKLKYEYKE